MPTRIWLLRHAETALPHIFHGAESDVGLSERGQRQARAAANVLAAYRPDAVVSSAMRRARETAEPIAQACQRELRLEPDLHERRVGALSGQPNETEWGIWPDTLRRWMEGDTAFAPPGAESFDAVRDRVVPVWQRLADQFAGRSLIIVAHGIVCRVLQLTLLPEYGPADWMRLGKVRNLSLSELVHDGQVWRAERLNEVPREVSDLL